MHKWAVFQIKHSFLLVLIGFCPYIKENYFIRLAYDIHLLADMSGETVRESAFKKYDFYKEPTISKGTNSEDEMIRNTFISCRGVKYASPIVNMETLTPFVEQYLKNSARTTSLNHAKIQTKKCQRKIASSKLKKSKSASVNYANRKIKRKNCAELKVNGNAIDNGKCSDKVPKRSISKCTEITKTKTKQKK